MTALDSWAAHATELLPGPNPFTAASALIAVGPGASFPHDAVTVIDDFNRANETPIASPWDTVVAWSGFEAKLADNRFCAPGITSGGGADWTVAQTGDFEAIIEIVTIPDGTTNWLMSAEFGGITFNYLALGLYGSLVSFQARRGLGDPPYEVTVAATPASGDLIGIRRFGDRVEGWYKPISGGWQLIGLRAGGFSNSAIISVEGDNFTSDAFADNFRLALYTGGFEGVAYDATPDLRPTVSLATATGAAFGGSSALGPMVATATGTGTAYNATADIQEGGGLSVNAELASGIGAAYNPTVEMLQLAAAITSHGPPLGAAIVTGYRVVRRRQVSKRILTLDDPEELWLLDLEDLI